MELPRRTSPSRPYHFAKIEQQAYLRCLARAANAGLTSGIAIGDGKFRRRSLCGNRGCRARGDIARSWILHPELTMGIEPMVLVRVILLVCTALLLVQPAQAAAPVLPAYDLDMDLDV